MAGSLLPLPSPQLASVSAGLTSPLSIWLAPYCLLRPQLVPYYPYFPGWHPTATYSLCSGELGFTTSCHTLPPPWLIACHPRLISSAFACWDLIAPPPGLDAGIYGCCLVVLVGFLGQVLGFLSLVLVLVHCQVGFSFVSCLRRFLVVVFRLCFAW